MIHLQVLLPVWPPWRMGEGIGWPQRREQGPPLGSVYFPYDFSLDLSLGLCSQPFWSSALVCSGPCPLLSCSLASPWFLSPSISEPSILLPLLIGLCSFSLGPSAISLDFWLWPLLSRTLRAKDSTAFLLPICARTRCPQSWLLRATCCTWRRAHEGCVQTGG